MLDLISDRKLVVGFNFMIDLVGFGGMLMKILHYPNIIDDAPEYNGLLLNFLPGILSANFEEPIREPPN